MGPLHTSFFIRPFVFWRNSTRLENIKKNKNYSKPALFWMVNYNNYSSWNQSTNGKNIQKNWGYAFQSSDRFNGPISLHEIKVILIFLLVPFPAPNLKWLEGMTMKIREKSPLCFIPEKNNITSLVLLVVTLNFDWSKSRGASLSLREGGARKHKLFIIESEYRILHRTITEFQIIILFSRLFYLELH